MGSKDFAYKIAEDDASLQKSFSLYVGDVSTSFNSEKQYVESIDKKCKNENRVLNCLKLMTDKQNEISYIAFFDAINAYLVTVKNLPSEKRLPSVVFGYRTDVSTTISGKETYKTPVSNLLEKSDYNFFNTISNSLKSN